MIAVHLFIFLFHNFCTFCHLSLCIHWEQRIDQPPDKLTQECEFSSDFWTRIEDSGYFPGSSDSKNPPAMQETWVLSLDQKKNPWRRKWQPTPVFLHGESLGQRSLAGYSL